MPLYTVPKFTEMETKIVGPLTFRQVIFIFATVGICFILYNILPKFLALPLIFLVGGFGIALAFFKIGGIPLHEMVLAGFLFRFFPREFRWGGKKGKEEPFTLKEIELKKEEKGEIKLKRESKLKEILIKTETKK